MEIFSSNWRKLFLLETDYKLTSWQQKYIRGNADKFLDRPGRRQVTATKLGIYSTHSPRRSFHYLAQCSIFYKPLKKIQKFVRPTGLRGSNDLHVGRKIATFQLFFLSRLQVVVRSAQFRTIGWVIKKLEAQVGLKFPPASSTKIDTTVTKLTDIADGYLSGCSEFMYCWRIVK